jgi:hypothetical protein
MKTITEQEAERDAKPFPVDQWGRQTSKCTAIIDENGAICRIIITSPYPYIYAAKVVQDPQP